MTCLITTKSWIFRLLSFNLYYQHFFIDKFAYMFLKVEFNRINKQKSLTYWSRILWLSGGRVWANPYIWLVLIQTASYPFFKGTIAAHTDNYDSEKQSRNCPVLTQHQRHRKRRSLVEKFSFYNDIRLTKEQSQPFINWLINLLRQN